MPGPPTRRGRIPGGGAGASLVSVQRDSGGGSRLMPPLRPEHARPLTRQTLGRRQQPGRAEHPSRREHRPSAERSSLLGDHLGPQVHQHLGDVDRDRADVVAGAAEGGGVRQRRVELGADAAQLRGEDRADRARVRPSRRRGRRRARRPGRRSGRPSSGCSAAPGGRPRRRAPSVRPLSSRTRWKSWARRRVDAGPGRGVGVHPLGGGASAAAAGGRPPGPARSARSFSMPTTRDQRLGQGQAHPAVALGLHARPACRSRRPRSWRRRSPTLARRNVSRRWQPGRLGERARARR